MSLISVFAIVVIHSGKVAKNLLIGEFLGVLWIGIVYHLIHFTVINKAAYGYDERYPPVVALNSGQIKPCL